MRESKERGISRRDFLGLAGVVLAGSGCGSHEEVFRTNEKKNVEQFPDKFKLFYQDYDKLEKVSGVVDGRAYKGADIRPSPTLQEIVSVPEGVVYKISALNAEYIENNEGIILKYGCRVPAPDLLKRIVDLQGDKDNPILQGVNVSQLSSSNILLFNGRKDAFGDFSSLRNTLNFIDIAPRQIRVTISALEYFNDNTYDREIDLNIFSLEKGVQIFTANLPSSPDPKKSLQTGMVYNPFYDFNSHKYTVTGLWKFLNSYGRSEVATHIDTLVINGEKSEISDQTNIPYKEFLEGKTGFIQGIKYRDTGTLIMVTPHANDEGFITLDVDIEKGEQIGFVGTEQEPVFKTSTYKTNYMARNGEPVLVGTSSASRYTQVDRSGIPILKDIPLVGPLFSSKETEKNKMQTAYVITARVIERKDVIPFRIKDGNLLPENLRRDINEKGFGVSEN